MLFPAPTGIGKGKSALRGRILDKINSKPGGVSARALRDLAGKQGVLGASDKEVRVEIDEMLSHGLIVRRQPTDAERRIHGLAGQVREVLVAAN
jgi:hypothetical protein